MLRLNQPTNTITLAISGASGIPYGLRLLECLLEKDKSIYFTISQAALMVIALETDLKFPKRGLQDFLCKQYSVSKQQLTVVSEHEWTAPIASGTGAADAMVVCPCSTGCLAAIATGMSDNVLERAADVMIKENRPLILVPRETPFSAIHLQHMLNLAQLGVTILPPNPGFYFKPTSVNELIDFVVGKILDQLNIKHKLVPKWGLE